jgi:hypothetical protein
VEKVKASEYFPNALYVEGGDVHCEKAYSTNSVFLFVLVKPELLQYGHCFPLLILTGYGL